MLLQHGSFLLGPEHRKIVDLFPDTQQNLKQRFKKQLQEKTISLSETGSDLEFPEIAEAISRGFTDTLGLTLETGSLSSYEKQLTEHLVDTKYGTKDWNFRESEMDSTAICPLA
jgi:lipoate-protein ligase A